MDDKGIYKGGNRGIVVISSMTEQDFSALHSEKAAEVEKFHRFRQAVSIGSKMKCGRGAYLPIRRCKPALVTVVGIMGIEELDENILTSIKCK